MNWCKKPLWVHLILPNHNLFHQLYRFLIGLLFLNRTMWAWEEVCCDVRSSACEARKGVTSCSSSEPAPRCSGRLSLSTLPWSACISLSSSCRRCSKRVDACRHEEWGCLGSCKHHQHGSGIGIWLTIQQEIKGDGGQKKRKKSRGKWLEVINSQHNDCLIRRHGVHL